MIRSGRRGRGETPRWINTIILFMLFLLVVFGYELVRPVLSALFSRQDVLVGRTPLYELAGQHIFMVLASGALSVGVALLLGVISFFPLARDFRELLLDLSSLGETFPSVAIIALSVPILGYGFQPTLLALFIYGVLPVLRNTITGIENVPGEVVDSAYGMGMGRLRVMLAVELPLALPVIIAGIRTSMIMIISAATIGATVGAGGFGAPIISGIRSYDTLMILQGSVPVALLAVAVDSFFINLEKVFTVNNNKSV